MADRYLTPQQEAFLANYTDPKSATFGNATQSAKKANYSDEYADNIMALLPDWLSENIVDMKRVRKAEKNLDEVQNLNIYDENGKADAQIIDKRNKVDFFMLETVAKAKYSKRTETDLTSKGDKISFAIINYADNNTPSVQAETLPDTSA